MPQGKHITIPARALDTIGRDTDQARTPAVAALRAQIAEAARAMPPTVDGRDGRPCTPQEAVAALLTWAGDDEAKLRRALRRALELTTPRVAAAHAQPPGSPRVAAPRVRPRWRPPASPWDPNAPKGRPRAGRR